MKRFFPALLVCGCAADKTDADFRADVTAEMHATIDGELAQLASAARALQAAAPDHAWHAATDAAALAQLRAAWRDTRIAYEHVEGAIAPLFPDIDFAIDARYDDYLAQAGDDGDVDPFDGTGATGMHAIERILFADQVRDEVIAFESTLPGYRVPAFPATDADALRFKTALVGQLISDVDLLRAQWQPAAIDVGAAFVGLVGLTNEQREKVNLAATGEEESRYANCTLFDLRNNLAGTQQVYAAFRDWVRAKSGGPNDARITAQLTSLADLYAGDSDALPPVPETWSSAMPSPADLATPFGQLWSSVHAAADPTVKGSLVSEMNDVATLLGFPEFVAR